MPPFFSSSLAREEQENGRGREGAEVASRGSLSSRKQPGRELARSSEGKLGGGMWGNKTKKLLQLLLQIRSGGKMMRKKTKHTERKKV